jgi:hypothetical protein
MFKETMQNIAKLVVAIFKLIAVLMVAAAVAILFLFLLFCVLAAFFLVFLPLLL